MENAADALKMAAAVLIFVLALSVIILSFSQVREATDTILSYRDRETTYIDGDLYYKGSDKTLARTVGLESIIPSIYRAYIENYKIVFVGLDKPIYEIKKNDGTTIDKFSIDLETNTGTNYENVVLASTEQKQEFLNAILYQKFSTSQEKETFQDKYSVILPDKGLYEVLSDKLKSNQITEELGVYYQNDDPNTPNVNKTEKRIITYTVISK